MAFDPRHQSRVLLDGPDRAAARSFFKAIGFTNDDLAKPLSVARAFDARRRSALDRVSWMSGRCSSVSVRSLPWATDEGSSR